MAEAAELPRSQGVFQRVRKIEERHIDELGHVNNVVWVRFVVELAAAHSAAVGLDLATLRGRIGGLWIVHRHEVDYHRPARLGEEVLEETWISEMRGALSLRHARFSRREDGALLVSATTRWAFVDAVRLRPRRIPPEVRDAFPLHEAGGAV
jgi:acyl-CoA thioester hydrolase